jgi:hypothetical protein
MTRFAHEVWREEHGKRQWIHAANPTVLVETYEGRSRVTLVGDHGVVAARAIVPTSELKKVIFAIHDAFDFAAPGHSFAMVSTTSGPTKGGGVPPVPQPPVPGGMPPDPAVLLANLELHGRTQVLGAVLAQSPASTSEGVGFDAGAIGVGFTL